MDDDPRLLEVFLDIQRGLPRQGPGSDDATREALALCTGLPDRPAVLDVGCGPGRQTMVLAQALEGPITAVDVHEEYLEQLRRNAAAVGHTGRIDARIADMNVLPFAPDQFDLIWAEGSAYIMGVENALRTWRQFLRPGGCLAATELVWLTPDRPSEATAFFGAEYPAMGDIEAALGALRRAGYEPLGHFTLPARAWWEHYYTPLEAKLPGLRQKYADDPAALEIVESTAREIDIRRRFGTSYGYVFVVGRRPA